MTNTIAGHNYAEDLTNGIEAATAPTTRGIQLFDLNGRQVLKAQKGITIVRKVMSDGTIRTEKVVVK